MLLQLLSVQIAAVHTALVVAQTTAAKGAADAQAVATLVAGVEELVARAEQKCPLGRERATPHRRRAALADGERAEELARQVEPMAGRFVATPVAGSGVARCGCCGTTTTTRADRGWGEGGCGPWRLSRSQADRGEQSGKRKRESAKLQVHHEIPFREWGNDVRVKKRLVGHR